MARYRFPPLAALALLVSASPALAQTMTTAEQAAVQLALDRGQRLYSFDQATWHATDALMADAGLSHVNH